MLRLTPAVKVYLAADPVDMRKSIDGLALIVQLKFKLDPFSESLFVFTNRGKDKLKILFWDHNGFWLYYRRLETGRFKWPTGESGKAIEMTDRQLSWLLDGIDISKVSAHRAVLKRKII